MNAYIYQAALLCEDCANARGSVPWGVMVCDTDAHVGANSGNRSLCDSECTPIGPYANGGGESDAPEHCDTCGLFLENPLTSDGLEGVNEIVAYARHLSPGYLTSDINEWPLSAYVAFYGLAVTA